MPHVRSFAPSRGVCCLLICSDQGTGHARFPHPIRGLGSVTVPQVGKLELSLRCVTRETGILNGMTSAGFCYILWPCPCKSPVDVIVQWVQELGTRKGPSVARLVLVIISSRRQESRGPWLSMTLGRVLDVANGVRINCRGFPLLSLHMECLHYFSLF